MRFSLLILVPLFCFSIYTAEASKWELAYLTSILAPLVKFENPLSKYIISNVKLGFGKYGNVFEASVIGKPEQRIVVKKLILKRKEQIETAINEISSLKKLSGISHVVKYIESFHFENTLYIFSEQIQGRSVQAIPAQYITSQVLISMAHQLLQALGSLAQHGICHKDIDTSNLMIDTTGSLMILDFGRSRIISTKGVDPTITNKFRFSTSCSDTKKAYRIFKTMIKKFSVKNIRLRYLLARIKTLYKENESIANVLEDPIFNEVKTNNLISIDMTKVFNFPESLGIRSVPLKNNTISSSSSTNKPVNPDVTDKVNNTENQPPSGATTVK